MKLIVVTPAGRERYLRLLSHYVLGCAEVVEWQLWDNCRNESDRRYLRTLAASDPRCTIKELPGADGGFGIIGDFYRFCDDPDALYLRLDDDVVYAEPGFFEAFKARAIAARGSALWFAPMIINNTICGSLLKNLSKVIIDGPITCQAMCPYAWRYAAFPKALHPVFIDAVKRGRLDDFRVPDRDIRLSRFSINAIAFFGEDIRRLGELFFPPAGNEEEWFSAALPARLDTCGHVFGNLFVSHFSFYTQEQKLLQTDILDRYYELAGLPVPHYEKPVDHKRLKDRLRPWRRPKTAHIPRYAIALREPSAG
ncbi:hypothetical protein [Mesorhizobium marinum]|uniref:Glycosyltransferase 2-like domain-containing protein n=1 Tax=Mesorhizobium marinum TaxID=3228790 RepID=A0ABV3R556_9HYPH